MFVLYGGISIWDRIAELGLFENGVVGFVWDDLGDRAKALMLNGGSQFGFKYYLNLPIVEQDRIDKWIESSGEKRSVWVYWLEDTVDAMTLVYMTGGEIMDIDEVGSRGW